MVKIENLESGGSSSSDENENQEFAETRDKTELTSQDQTRNSSVTRTEFWTLEPGFSKPRTSRIATTLEHLFGSGLNEPGVVRLKTKTKVYPEIPIAGHLINTENFKPNTQKASR